MSIAESPLLLVCHKECSRVPLPIFGVVLTNRNEALEDLQSQW
jgi:hypothetical protein